MKQFLLIPFLLLSFISSFSQDVNTLIKEAIQTEKIPNEEAALLKYKEVVKVQPTNILGLTKCSELCCRIGSRQKNTKTRDAWFAAALVYAKKALAIAPLSDQANVAMAMYLGKSSLTKGGKEKIKSVKEIKSHLDIALKTNPNNYLAWHILGRWNYEISNVNSLERTAAKVFFGGIPQGSMKNAIMYFEKARSLEPDFILNDVELAKAYHKDGQTAKAISILKSVQAFPISTEDDAALKKDALKMIKDWQ